MDQNRVSLILAVLEKRVGISLANQDVFVNHRGRPTHADEPADRPGDCGGGGVEVSRRSRWTPATVLRRARSGSAGEVRAVGHDREAAARGRPPRLQAARSNLRQETRPALRRLRRYLKVIGVESVRQAIDAVLALTK